MTSSLQANMETECFTRLRFKSGTPLNRITRRWNVAETLDTCFYFGNLTETQLLRRPPRRERFRCGLFKPEASAASASSRTTPRPFTVFPVV